MMSVQSKDGTRIAYDVYGSGSSLIYCTGAGSFRTSRPVVRAAKTFANSFTLFCYDRRGRGDSGNFPPYAIGRELEDIEAMINVAGGRASLFGHSTGAVLALEAALRFSHKIDHLVLYEPAYAYDQADQERKEQLRHAIQLLLRSGKRAKALSYFLRWSGTPYPLILWRRMLPTWQTMLDLSPSLLYDIELSLLKPPIEQAARLDLPVLVAVGEKSAPSLQAVAHQLGEAIPNASFMRVSGQGYQVCSRVMLRMLSDFIQPMHSVSY